MIQPTMDTAIGKLTAARDILSKLGHPLARSLSLDIGTLKGEQQRAEGGSG